MGFNIKQRALSSDPARRGTMRTGRLPRLPATLAAAALLLLGASPLTGQDTATLEGRVSGPEGAAPDAEVVVSGPSLPADRRVRADDDGRFTVRRLPPGDYRVRVSALGHRQAVREVAGLEAGEVRRLAVTLDRRPYRVGDLEVVTATRSREPVREVPAAVSVIDRAELVGQGAVTTDLGEMLGQRVPGLSPTTESQTNFGQTLRGRDLEVLIDGVPITTPLRNGERSLRTIDPSAVERVEVVRGATAAYGFGGTAGIINFLTREPAGEELSATTEVRWSAADDAGDGSLDARVSQSVSGSVGRFGFVAAASYQSHGRRYDARGDMIPVDPQGQGGLAGADGTSLFGKATLSLSPAEDLSLTASRYDLMQEDPEFVTEPGVPGEEKARAVPGDPGSEAVGNTNTMVQARYRNGDLLGSSVAARAYYLDNLSRFGFSPFFGSSSRITAEKHGARLDVQSPLDVLVDGARVTWGADYLHDETAQPLGDGRFFVPPMRQTSMGPFVQLRVPLTGRLTARGGLRHEEIWLDVDDFTTLREVGGNSVEGGSLQYGATVLNAGLTYGLTHALEGFASFSQGFSVAEVGRELRTTSAPSVEALSPAPKETDHVELGVRGRWDRLRVSASVYRNESDLGSSFGPDLRIVRAPERIRGLESTVDVSPAEGWRLGGTLTLVEGEQDADGDGDVDEPLGALRVPPTKVTAYAEGRLLPGWRARVQALHSGSRAPFPGGDGFGRGAVDAYTVLDVSTGVELWRGTVELGVRNLLDEFYFPVASQATNLGFAYSAGQGRRVALLYRIDW
jgi:iron complex outermembrane receptor protein